MEDESEDSPLKAQVDGMQLVVAALEQQTKESQDTLKLLMEEIMSLKAKTSVSTNIAMASSAIPQKAKVKVMDAAAREGVAVTPPVVLAELSDTEFAKVTGFKAAYRNKI